MFESLLPIVGGLLGGAQQSSAAQAAENGVNRRYELSREDQMPFLQTGYGANSMLAHLMGIKANNPALRQRLTSKYTTPGVGGQWVLSNSGTGEGDLKEWTPNASQIDEAGLQGEIDSQGMNDPTFGSLLRDFSEEDIYGDPIFKMAQKEAADAVNERAMRGGMYNSGATLKELMKANSGVGSDAFNRWNTQQGTKYNRLANLMGAGQQAVNQVGNLGAQAAQQAGEYGIQGANARTAGIVSGINSWTQSNQRKQDQDFLRGIWGA